ncbi:hypothetical protein BDF14DRAFT_1734846 [Spinellus fusiger]|nr:hypothetical protein BDF14DRAFT_1734846 [Spinellus fusiger]
MYPLNQTEALIKTAEESIARIPSTGISTGFDTKFSSQTIQPVNSKDKKYTTRQVEDVREVLSYGSDYYKILSIEKSSTDLEIKRAYRKLALQFHPDKNHAPGADEAFKLILRAFTVLSDPQKRTLHDHGDTDRRQPTHTGSYQSSHFTYQQGYFPHRRHGRPLNREEMFNMFFQGGNDPRFQNYSSQHRQSSSGFGWFIFIALLFLIAFSFSTTLFPQKSSTPTYSFTPTSIHSQRRTTYSYRVPYYVSTDAFKATNKARNKLNLVEEHVERQWIKKLQQSCQSEQKNRSYQMKSAEGAFFGIGRNMKQYKEATRMRLENCERLRKLGFTVRS